SGEATTTLRPVGGGSDTTRDAHRDRLYASVCSSEPARSAAACAQAPPVLQSEKPNKSLIRIIAAATYALAVLLAQRRWGRDRVGWAAVPGSMAACFASLLAF